MIDLTDLTICTAAGTLYRAPNRLGLFDQINLAKCAADRAKVHCNDSARFDSEYIAANHWAQKRVIVGW
jgi:hypothetical protein